MQIIDAGVFGARSAVLRLQRTGAALNFVVFPMLHVASPRFYADVTARLLQCDLLFVEGCAAGQRSAGRSPRVTRSSPRTGALGWWRRTSATGVGRPAAQSGRDRRHDVEERLDDVFCAERDRRLIAALSDLHDTRSGERIDVAVGYGAGHVAAIVHALAATLGYRPKSAEWLTVLEA